ncbi:hypothetical protein ARAM_002309 [Aspergillus rambellii]|uniref:Uncharacterized protein n=1 Tax=Aspergillus rambellii TaxID=308745 RepID=A0A0F8URI1_9EURO|nr:hypothetical protein ARAM_002309 [Aspergillus rambellii]
MDLQGHPIPPGQRRTKATTDPMADRQPIYESSGPVLNDSLAAESVNRGGPYSENRGAEPLGVTSGQSTVHNIDTSAATKLSSAPVSAFREDRQRQEKYPEALGDQGNYPGAHLPGSGYVGGPTAAAKKELGINENEYPASGKPPQSGATASGSGYQTQTGASQKPSYAGAGQRGDESYFPDYPEYNASFDFDIGDENDPGRLAESGFPT